MKVEKREYEKSEFVRAACSLAAALPKRVQATNEDLAEIVIPGWRYNEIAKAVLATYEKANAHVMPLPVFDIAHALGYSTIPYRAFGKRFHDVFLEASEDSLTMQFNRSSEPVILYNDRVRATRVNFSIMHEVGHNVLEHMEQSPLAEKEANYFASLALCPVDLLEHLGISNAKTIAELFNVSDEFARNRLSAIGNRRNMVPSVFAREFHNAVISRFRLDNAYQMELFSNPVEETAWQNPCKENYSTPASFANPAETRNNAGTIRCSSATSSTAMANTEYL